MSENEKENPQPWAPSTLQDVGWLVSKLRDCDRKQAEYKAALAELLRLNEIERKRLESFLPLCEEIIAAFLPRGRKSVVYTGPEGAFKLKLTATPGGLKVTDEKALVAYLAKSGRGEALRATVSVTVTGDEALDRVASGYKAEPVMGIVKAMEIVPPGCVLVGPHQRVGWDEIGGSDAD